MGGTALLTFFAIPAVTLAVVYHPILAKLSVALVSPYAKADVKKRVFAAAVDGMLVATALVLYRAFDNPVLGFVGALYLLLRDAVSGRSVGKLLCGLVVINLETGRPGATRASINRNLLLLLPGANVVAVCFEALTMVRDPQGQRLGDRFAATQVIEGFGAKDVVRAMQTWWLDFIARLDGNPRKEGRVTVKHAIDVG